MLLKNYITLNQGIIETITSISNLTQNLVSRERLDFLLCITYAILIYHLTKTGKYMLAIRLPQDIEDRLNKLAKKTGRTKTFYAREAILQYIEDMEDYYTAKDRLKNPGKIWSIEEVEQQLDLDH